MRTSEKLIKDCQDHIERLQQLVGIVKSNEALLDKCDPHSSGIGSYTLPKLVVFPPFVPELHRSEWSFDPKELARALGGEWKRDVSNEGAFFDYKRDGEFPVVIFSAEPREQEKELHL